MRTSRNPNPGRASALGTLVAVIAAGALLGGVAVAGFRAMSPAVAEAADPAAKPAAKPAAPAQKPAAPAAAPAAKPGTPAANPATAQKTPAAKPADAKTVATRPGVVRPAPARGNAATAAPAKPSLVQPLTQLDDHITYQYNTLGRRDPFNPLLGGEFVGLDEGGSAPVETGGMTVVGIVWGAEDKFALVEDARGNSVILRQGDKVMNGYVEALKRDAVIVNISMDGQEQSVAIPLTKKGDSNANR